ncbi:hypothetical protein QBC39DRAFT_74519 [Podospora conica]|nr:hypothetical protein QBC39DRAFT_74519 [Schizothecium conicum]
MMNDTGDGACFARHPGPHGISRIPHSAIVTCCSIDGVSWNAVSAEQCMEHIAIPIRLGAGCRERGRSSRIECRACGVLIGPCAVAKRVAKRKEGHGQATRWPQFTSIRCLWYEHGRLDIRLDGLPIANREGRDDGGVRTSNRFSCEGIPRCNTICTHGTNPSSGCRCGCARRWLFVGKMCVCHFLCCTGLVVDANRITKDSPGTGAAHVPIFCGRAPGPAGPALALATRILAFALGPGAHPFQPIGIPTKDHHPAAMRGARGRSRIQLNFSCRCIHFTQYSCLGHSGRPLTGSAQ